MSQLSIQRPWGPRRPLLLTDRLTFLDVSATLVVGRHLASRTDLCTGRTRARTAFQHAHIHDNLKHELLVPLRGCEWMASLDAQAF